MNKRKFAALTNIYLLSVFAVFAVYAYIVQEDWKIDMATQKYNILLFLLLFIIGSIMAGIDASSLNTKGKSIDKKTFISGTSLAGLFIIWRLIMAFV